MSHFPRGVTVLYILSKPMVILLLFTVHTTGSTTSEIIPATVSAILAFIAGIIVLMFATCTYLCKRRKQRLVHSIVNIHNMQGIMSGEDSTNWWNVMILCHVRS